MEPSHFSLKATNSFKSPETLPKASRKIKKNRFATKGSLLDDLQIDAKGKLFLPTQNLKSPKKQHPSKMSDIKDFISNTVPTKMVDLFVSTSNSKE